MAVEPVSDSPFLRGVLTLTVALLPAALGLGADAPRLALNEILMKYHSGLGGFLVAYSRARFAASGPNALEGHPRVPVGRIFGELPVVHVRVRAEVLLFAPRLGAVLRGVVSFVGDGHIGALVAGLFNATVLLEDMAGGYVFAEGDATEGVSAAAGRSSGSWVSTDVWASAAAAAVAAEAAAEGGGGAGMGAGVGAEAAAPEAVVAPHTSRKRRRGAEEAGVAGGGEVVSAAPLKRGAAFNRILASNPSVLALGDTLTFRVRAISHGLGVFVIHGALS